MSEYIKALKDSGIIQYLRKTLPENELEVFDKLVEEKVKEYNQMWLDSQPTIADYNNKVNKYASKSQPESRPTAKSDEEQS